MAHLRWLLVAALFALAAFFVLAPASASADEHSSEDMSAEDMSDEDMSDQDMSAEDMSDDSALRFGGWVQGQVSGVFSDNVGVLGGPELNIGDHGIGLSLYLGGGTHLRTGAALRYRLQIIDEIAWWIAPGIAFDVLFVDDVTVWSRLTMLSTGVELSLGELFFVGVDFTVSPRVSPLSVTFVDDGESRRQLEHGADELPYDLAFGVLRPGVSFGLRL